MSFFPIHVLTDEQVKTLKAAGHQLEEFALSEGQKAVALLKKSDVGQTVAAEIHALADSTLSGPEKFEKVLAGALPLVAKFVAGGGVEVAIEEAEDLGRELVQSVYDDVKSSSVGRIAAAAIAAAEALFA